jgi:hypothetical protein
MKKKPCQTGQNMGAEGDPSGRVTRELTRTEWREDLETRRQGDKETRRQGDRETGRRGDGKSEGE